MTVRAVKSGGCELTAACWLQSILKGILIVGGGAFAWRVAYLVRRGRELRALGLTGEKNIM